MSFLVRAIALRHLQGLSRSIATCLPRNAAYNYDDFKPGPKPKTREEAEAAAKKYNLLPSEYEPYPDVDGLGRGDYPKLPNIAVEERDPNYPWDYPEHKRNYGEPMHSQIDMIGEDRYNISMRPRYTAKQMLATFLGIMTFFYGTFFFLEDYKMFRPVLAKQYPAPGVLHYSFEPNNSSSVIEEDKH